MAREEDRKKFVDLANKRVNNAVKAIRLIGNLSNKTNYFYTEDDVKKIFRTLQRELKTSRERFSEGQGKNEGEFQLS